MKSAVEEGAEAGFDAGALALIVGVGDGAGLTTELETEERLFELVEAASDLAVEIGHVRGDRRRGGCCGRRRFRARRSGGNWPRR